MNDTFAQHVPERSRHWLELNGPDRIWYVEKGTLDVAIVCRAPDGRRAGPPRFLFTIKEGQAAFDIGGFSSRAGECFYLVARLSAAARLTMITTETAGAISLAEQLDHWVAMLSESGGLRTAGAGMTAPLSRPFSCEAGTRVIAPDGKTKTVWLSILSGQLQFADAEDVLAPGSPPIGLTAGTWVTAIEASGLLAQQTTSLIARGEYQSALSFFGHCILRRFAQRWENDDTAQASLRANKRNAAVQAFQTSLSSIAAILQPRAVELISASGISDLLASALAPVAEYVGISFGIVPTMSVFDPQAVDTAVQQLPVASRRIRLAPGWEREPTTAMLGLMYSASRGRLHPVALIPTPRGFKFIDSESGQGGWVDTSVTSRISPDAWVFFRSLANAPVSGRDLLRFGFFGNRSDLVRIVVTGLAGALLGLVIPAVTSELFSNVLPRADSDAFVAILLAMAAATIGQVAFDLVRSFSSLGLEGRIEGDIQAAIWDRLLRLPTGFFRSYSTGDLADRVTGIATIRAVLTSTLTRTALDALFSTTSFVLLFWYSWRLALIAVGMGALAVGVTIFFSFLQIPHQRATLEQTGKLESLTFQILVAVAKLRSGGAEPRLFARWSELFARQKISLLLARRIGAAQGVFSQVFATLTTMVIFAAVIWLGDDASPDRTIPLLSAGGYIAFNTALGQSMRALLALVSAGATLIVIFPLFERVRPILEATPETTRAAEVPGILAGEIVFSGVSFRYAADAPSVLADLSFQIPAGQHVAIVGPSGSGKSTVLRLLLGFERPERGTVMFDGKDLASMDLKALRRQLGVVLQRDALLPCSIFENIVGASGLSMDDAWEAVRLAGFDRDLRAMPMGMHTVLSGTFNTLSGGQRQRLMIARALVRRPRLVILDEATSALDNQTQSVVLTNLTAMQVTRVVVAHRLSTTKDADRILVLQDGRLVEDGRYEDLMEAGGLFWQLARRQET